MNTIEFSNDINGTSREQITSGSSKGRPLETLNIPDIAFEEASRLCTYGKQIGFVWKFKKKFEKNWWCLQFYLNTIYGIDQHTLQLREFKNQLFLDKDLANAIQHFRKGDPEQDPENDASNLLKELLKRKEEDPTWFIAYHCVKNRLFHLF
ncbi:10335_t:CDS:2 [Funneliformis geosporum]|uniref:10335_t:CDS:1 n=1 Tax=Funneliformis geosporum TaxID=1117311 RepID=A0A9W4SNQ9_9GLOM|nr:10335_t:CDS:2 [Funneliformis geosporum]